MGDYTECVFRGSIDARRSPKHRAVQELLCAKLGRADVLSGQPPADREALVEVTGHPLFETPRYRMIGRAGSFYHHPEPVVSIYASRLDGGLPSDDGTLWFFLRFDLKNYDNEIELFFDYLQPYLCQHEGEWIGYILSEYDKQPKPVFKDARRAT